MKIIMFLSMSLLGLITAGTLSAETPTPPTEKPPAGRFAKPAAHSMMGLGVESPKSNEPISGKVLETMDNGGYSYIYLQMESGDKAWVAVMETPVEVGSRMSFKSGIVMSNFESKGLKRTFDKIVFSDGMLTKPETASTADLKKKQAASLGSKGSTIAKEQKISVAKATGANAITVEEAFTMNAKLDKKKVVVRGKVIKVSAGIMKRNWIHIQDGSSSQTKGTNNLVCTSQDMVNVGDVVTVSGTLVKDRDFGGGYRYSAIIENARIKK